MRRALAAMLMLAGALALADAALTLAWQEPLSALAAAREQPRLRAKLRALELATPAPTAAQRHGAAAASARALRTRTRDGDAVARLGVARIGLDAVVVRGTRPEDLEQAPGLFDAARLPGERGTALIAGHRTTYGAPFRHIDRLRRGDTITVAMPYGTFRYAVEGTRIVDPGDVRAALRTVGHARLVLSACHPLFSAARRILVYAAQVGVGQPARALKRVVHGTR
jgi:sortase A